MSSTRPIDSVEQLDEQLSEPTPGVLETLHRLEGDLLILGVGGKMGPTLARMAAWASQAAGVKRRVIGVARFSRPDLPDWLQRHGVVPHQANLLDPAQLAALPSAENVLVMTALKFGSTGRPGDTWAVNCWLPAAVCERFRDSRIVGFSTGNVYPLTPIVRGGSLETDPLLPIGEYAASCVGRERLYDYFSRTNGTPISIVRLNYACELRYGVLVDLARQVWQGEPVDLSMGAVNVIWQGDANAMTLQTFGHVSAPPFVLNVAGPETLSVRQVCEQLGEMLGKRASFTGEERAEALLSNGQRGHHLLGYPRVPAGTLLEWIAHWIKRGGPLLDKPTKFQVSDGRF